MKKESLIIGVLVIVLIGLGILAFVFYNKNIHLGDEKNLLSSEKEQAISEREQCLADKKIALDELQMMQEDVAKIYKGCITDNACKGHYPGVRWNCNNVGDETNVNPSHICVCDSSCSLNATAIKNS